MFDAMTLDRWIALASSLGTVIAAIVAAWSIRELRRQSAKQYRPNVVITSAMFEVSTAVDDGFRWNALPEKVARFKDTADYRLTLLNLGNGAAVDLRVDWWFDVEAMIKVVNDMSIKRGAGIGMVRDAFGIAFLKDGETVAGARLPEQSGPRIDYILPVAQQKESTKIGLPAGLETVLFTYYALLLEPGANLDERLENSPKLPNTVKASMSYKDTTGRAYTQETSVSIGIFYLDPDTRSMGIGINPVPGEAHSFWQIVPKVMIEVGVGGLSGSLMIPTSFTKAIAEALTRRKQS